MPFSIIGFFFPLLLALNPMQGYSETLVDTLAKKYGIDAFKKAQEIHFTFHAGKMGLGLSHSWIWKPQKDSVTFVDDGLSYSRQNMDEKTRKVDQKFINDMYWLTFPLHLTRDKGIQVSVDINPTLSPIKKARLRKISVQYAQAIGYTPNDAYELFVTPDGLVKEWTYYKRGGKRGVSWTWENDTTAGGILFSQKHQGLVNIKFTGIEVK